MHAFLITGGNIDQRHTYIQKLLDEWNVSIFDRVVVDDTGPSIGIEQVRELQHRLLLKPMNSPLTALVINTADILTTEAQNALLKTLEEPPPNAKIILESQISDIFLPTVLSRCQLVNLGNTLSYTHEEILQCVDTLKSLGEVPVGKRLQKIDTLARTREGALSFVDLAITALRQDPVTTHTHAKLLRALLAARSHILGNITPKLALDAVFLS